MTSHSGKTVVVTGAAGGVGLGIARAFLDAGATVAMLDVNERLLNEAVKDLKSDRAVPYAADVSNLKQVKAAVDSFVNRVGGLDIVVNNAVHFHFAPLAEMGQDVVTKMIDVGLKGALWTLQAATPHLIARGGGSVINLSSIGVFTGVMNTAVYTSIKGGLDALTRQQALELAKHNIRVNAVAPGSIATPGASAVISPEQWVERAARTPLKRLATVDEVGAAAIFLTSDAARNITGVTLKVDAGVTIAGL